MVQPIITLYFGKNATNAIPHSAKKSNKRCTKFGIFSKKTKWCNDLKKSVRMPKIKRKEFGANLENASNPKN